MLYLERWKILQAARTLPASNWLSSLLPPTALPGPRARPVATPATGDPKAWWSDVQIALVQAHTGLATLRVRIRQVLGRYEQMFEREYELPLCGRCGHGLGCTEGCAGCAEFRALNSIF